MKALYGLKQVSHALHEKLIEHLLKLKHKIFDLDVATHFVNKFRSFVIYLVVYVDDLMITRNNDDYIRSIKREMQFFFNMSYLGVLDYYLGIEVDKNLSIFLFLRKIILDNCSISLEWNIVIVFLLQWSKT